MYKLVACWSAPRPEDVDAFEKHYLGIHAPLAQRVPHLQQIVLTRTDGGLEGSPPAFHRVAEMIFASPGELERSSHSAEWKALRADAGEMVARFGVTLSVGIGWSSEPAL